MMVWRFGRVSRSKWTVTLVLDVVEVLCKNCWGMQAMLLVKASHHRRALGGMMLTLK